MGFGVSLNDRRVSWGEGKRTFLRGSQLAPSWRDPRAWDWSALRCAWVQCPGRTAPYRTHGHSVPAARPSLQSPVRRPEVRSGPAIASRELEASRGFRSTPASGPTMCLRAQLPALNAGPESW